MPRTEKLCCAKRIKAQQLILPALSALATNPFIAAAGRSRVAEAGERHPRSMCDGDVDNCAGSKRIILGLFCPCL